MNFDKTIICSEQLPHTKVTVWAEIIDDCLIVTGQDSGEAVQDVFGKDEIKYFYRFNAANTIHLFELLGRGSESPDIVFHRRFGCIDGCEALREYCEVHRINYNFDSY